jgi:hypothetical protein
VLVAVPELCVDGLRGSGGDEIDRRRTAVVSASGEGGLHLASSVTNIRLEGNHVERRILISECEQLRVITSGARSSSMTGSTIATALASIASAKAALTAGWFCRAHTLVSTRSSTAASEDSLGDPRRPQARQLGGRRSRQCSGSDPVCEATTARRSQYLE